MIELNGKSEARGRNGYFHIARLWVRGMWNVEEQPIWIELQSKRVPDNAAPVSMQLTLEDAELLADQINQAIAGYKYTRSDPALMARLEKVGTIGVYGTDIFGDHADPA